jgi:hypothetical protein
MATRKVNIIIGLVLVLLLTDLGPIFGQASKTFTGKITEIAKGSELGVYKHGIFYTLRLDEYPGVQFRLSQDEAVRSGVIERTGPAEVVTPKMSKGLGWKVKLTCAGANFGDRSAPVYKVTSLERLGN